MGALVAGWSRAVSGDNEVNFAVSFVQESKNRLSIRMSEVLMLVRQPASATARKHEIAEWPMSGTGWI